LQETLNCRRTLDICLIFDCIYRIFLVCSLTPAVFLSVDFGVYHIPCKRESPW